MLFKFRFSDFLLIEKCPIYQSFIVQSQFFRYDQYVLYSRYSFLVFSFLDFSKVNRTFLNTLCSCKKGFASFNCCRHESNFEHLRLSLRAVLVICKGNNLLDVDATSDDNRTMPVYLSKPPIFHMQILKIQSYFFKKNAN